jgi:hypothetical protein
LAFQGCASLENITIPSTINYIGISAFVGCTSLSEEARQIIRQINPYAL